MTTSEVRQKAFDIWLASAEKFEYHLLTIQAALCGWIVQGWPAAATVSARPNWVQVGGFALLLVALGASLFRMERWVHMNSLAIGLAKREEAIVNRRLRAEVNRQMNCDISEDLEALEVRRAERDQLREDITGLKSLAGKLYRIKTWLFVIGFATYSLGRVLSLYGKL